MLIARRLFENGGRRKIGQEKKGNCKRWEGGVRGMHKLFHTVVKNRGEREREREREQALAEAKLRAALRRRKISHSGKRCKELKD